MGDSTKYIKVNGVWYHRPYLEVGDEVRRLTERRSWGNGPPKGGKGIVTHACKSIYTNDQIEGVYEYVYYQTIKLDDGPTTYRNTSFELTKLKKENSLLLEINRPTLVQEFGETTVDGKVVRKNIGDPIPFDSASAARVWCSNQITSSIRADNTYRKFSILTETAVAQAKEPEIEFK